MTHSGKLISSKKCTVTICAGHPSFCLTPLVLHVILYISHRDQVIQYDLCDSLVNIKYNDLNYIDYLTTVSGGNGPFWQQNITQDRKSFTAQSKHMIL